MYRSRVIFILNLSLGITHSQGVATITREIHLAPDTHIVASTIYKTMAAYVTCEKLDQSDRKCNLTSEVLDDLYAPIICPIPLRFKQGYRYGIVPKIFIGNDGEVVLIFSGSSDFESPGWFFSIFFRKPPYCNWSSVIVSLRQNFSSYNDIVDEILIIRHPSNYQFIYKDEGSCQNACSLIYNNEGKKLQNHTNLNLTEHLSGDFVLPRRSSYVGFESSGTGHCFVITSEERLNASLFFNEQVHQTLDPTRNTDFYSMRFTTAHQKMGICKQEKPDNRFLNCSSGDLRSWFNLTLNSQLRDPVIYSTANDKFFVLRSEALGNSSTFEILLTLFDSQKKFRFNLPMKTIECHNKPIHLRALIWESDGGDYCLSLFEEASRTSHILMKCLPKVVETFFVDTP
ncbi:hypothetical protein QAD02_024211 [Eretmocerus hayati]|uniref:Uncharacterized protein n=1 Tax=Eretmocerus hayati TaxID=131215 RepID=A0ACC2PXZ9_9HYME|nr:hypothetical protein QAD02_024211 [Eretmocerus hayati]